MEESLPQTLVEILAENDTACMDNERRFEEVKQDELDNITDVIFEDEKGDEEP